MTSPIRVLLVDDQALFREGLRTLLGMQPGLVVVGEAANGEEALRLAAKLGPQVVLMDLRMPVLDGVTATRRLHEAQPDCRVIVLTTFDDDEYVFEGLRAGAVGYLLKDVPSEKLAEAIRAAAGGESFLQPSVAAKVVAEFARLAEQASAKPLLRWLNPSRSASLRSCASSPVGRATRRLPARSSSPRAQSRITSPASSASSVRATAPRPCSRRRNSASFSPVCSSAVRR